VDNSASLVPQAPVAAGSIATIFAQNFGPRATAKTIPLPVSMSGVSVTVNGRPAPLFFVDPTQINFQVPLETPAGQATAVVTASGVPSAEFGFQVQDVEPGLYLAVNHKDGSINGPKHPAAVGDTLVVYLTGQGPLNQPSTDGVPTPLPPPLFSATKPYSATIGNVKATVTFLGLTPLLVAVGQANVHVPSLSTGAYPLVITVGGVASNSITINVK